jgi:phosphoserine phosphatase
MSNLVLIHIRGEDRRGLLQTMTQLMAPYEVEILDIAQSLIHDGLNFGMVVKLGGDPRDSAVIFRELLFKAHDLDLTIKFTPLSLDAYEQWASDYAESRYIVTLLSRQLTARQLSLATEIFMAHGLNIETIRRLSRPHSQIKEADINTYACVEFGVRGCPTELNRLKGQFLELSAKEGMDLAFQRDDVFRRNRRLVVFDMDSTLLKIEVIDELARQMNVVEEVSKITEAAMNGELDFDESFRRRVRLLKGMPRSVIDGIIEQMPLNDGAERLVKTLKSVGYKVAVLSGGFIYFVEALQRSLGIDYGYANALEFKDGLATGEVKGEIINGERKLFYMKKIAEQEGVALKQVIAVGDGANDLPMLSAAGLGVAFRAKALVKASADHSLSATGLDGVLYLLGFNDSELAEVSSL